MLIIRTAQAEDQPLIRSLVLRAHLNPMNLQWQRFVVAEDLHCGALAGIGQIRLHRDGVQELASIVVAPAYQRRGIGRAIVATLVAQTSGTLYLFCRGTMEPYYARFGFVAVDAERLPGSLAWMLRAGQAFSAVASWFRADPATVIAMRRG